MSDGNGELNWDTSDIRTQICDLATARSLDDRIVLNFGARAADEAQVQAFGARLARRILLPPAAARHLRDMLARAVAEPGPRHG